MRLLDFSLILIAGATKTVTPFGLWPDTAETPKGQRVTRPAPAGHDAADTTDLAAERNCAPSSAVPLWEDRGQSNEAAAAELVAGQLVAGAAARQQTLVFIGKDLDKVLLWSRSGSGSESRSEGQGWGTIMVGVRVAVVPTTTASPEVSLELRTAHPPVLLMPLCWAIACASGELG